MGQCESHLPQVLADLKQHLADSGAEAVSQFTIGKEAEGMNREVYCGGWFVVGRLLNDGMTFPQLGKVRQDEAEAKVAATIDAMLKAEPAGVSK